MRAGDWVRDRRPVRRVVADEAAPVEGREWPASIPAVAQVLQDGLELPAGVTLLVGENGSGKSTLVEAVAMAFGLAPEGGTRNAQAGTRTTESPLHRWIRLERAPGAPRWGFFLRAESYFNVATAIDSYGSSQHYGGSPHQRSHGESFIDLVVHRFGPNSLFLLDEPEAALSVHGQLQLLVRIHDLIGQGCQFIVATHSPLLMAYPDATIYEFGAHGPTSTTWSQIDTVHITTDFLNDPTGFLAELFAEDT